MKKIVKWAVILGIIGIILINLELSMGAKTVYSNMEIFNKITEFSFSKSKKEPIEEFENINIDSTNINIYFEDSEDDLFYIKKNIKDEYKDKVKVFNKENSLEINDVNIDSTEKSVGSITIYKPSSKLLNNIDIKCKNIIIEADYIDGKSLELDILNSKLDIGKLDCSEVNILSDKANIDIGEIKTDNINIENNSSNMDIELLNTGNINLINNGGNIDISTINAKIFTSKNNGNISIDILEAEEKNIEGDIDIN